jgi:hypothetical protein
MEAQALWEGKLGARARHRLEASESFDELTLLARLDRAGRRSGVAVDDVQDSLAYLRELAQTCGE